MIYLKIFLTIFILFALAFLWLPKNINNPYNYFFKKNCFAIKVVYWYTGDYGEIYRIVFTNNDWGTKEELLRLDDNTPYISYVSVYKSTFTGSLHQCQELAEKLDTYEECSAHNLKVSQEYDRLTKLYKEQKIPRYPSSEKKQAKKEPEIKEIIIKSCK